MTDLTPSQQETLRRGLEAFDAAVVRRRVTRRVVRRMMQGTAASLLVAVTALCAVALLRPTPQPRHQTVLVGRPLPAYVEIIRDDAHLTLELELASACERIGRTGGKLYVVECTSPR